MNLLKWQRINEQGDMMDFFTSAKHRHRLTFVKLAAHMAYLDIAAEWAEGEWGYIRNKGVKYRKGVLTDLKDCTYIGLFGGQPVALFVLFDKKISPELSVRGKVSELMYVYVDKPCRDLGFGRQIVDEAKFIARISGSDCITFDTLKTKLNPFYERAGAKVIAEGKLFSEPTDVLMMRV